MNSRRWILCWVVIGLAAVYAVLSFFQATEDAQTLRQREIEFEEVQQKLEQLAGIRQSPSIASINIESPASIGERIDLALRRAGLTSSTLLSQNPQSTERLGKSDFRIRETRIELESVEVGKLLQFCEELADPKRGLSVTGMTLREANLGEGSSLRETWRVDLVLTQVIYSPDKPGMTDRRSPDATVST